MLLWREFNNFEVNSGALAGCLSAPSAGSAQERKCQLMHLHFSLVCRDSLWAGCLRFRQVQNRRFKHTHLQTSLTHNIKQKKIHSMNSFCENVIIIINIDSSSHISKQLFWIWYPASSNHLDHRERRQSDNDAMRNVRETVKYFTVSQQLLKCHKPVPRTAESFD